MNPSMNAFPIKQGDREFLVEWSDMGTHMQLRVFENGTYLGHVDVALRVDNGINMAKYIIKSIFEGGRNVLVQER